jgi:ABC-type cobalamin/Fe3+-siderophores transport system ATPase subunit
MDAAIRFEAVSFRWVDEGDGAATPVFDDLDLELPHGIVSLVGQNGTGKSTLLALAAGSIVPDAGRVLVRGADTRGLRDEPTRQRLVSYIFQNMEFETDEPIGSLLDAVHAAGFHAVKRPAFVAELVEAFELAPVLARRTQEVSKGELQRTILAFSLLYGSPLLVMDEPIFALEDRQKERALEFLCAYARREGIGLYFSLHELDLSRRFSDHLLLFRRGGAPRLGPTAELFTRGAIEQAYEVPFDMLKQREALYRKMLTGALAVRGRQPAGEGPGGADGTPTS